MPKVKTKSFGVRMPVILYHWINRHSKFNEMNRSQYICSLVETARKGIAVQSAVIKPGSEALRISDVIWMTGVTLSSGVIIASLMGLFGHFQ